MLNVGADRLLGTGALSRKIAEWIECSFMARPMQSGMLQGPSVKRTGRGSRRSCVAQVRAAGVAQYVKCQLASVTED